MNATTVRLRPEIEKELDAMAASSRRTRSWLINEALGDYIARRKTGQARWEETLQAMESVAQGHAVPAETVHAWLKSWGTAAESKPPKAGR